LFKETEFYLNLAKVRERLSESKHPRLRRNRVEIPVSALQLLFCIISPTFLLVFFETCSEAKQIVSKRSRRSVEEASAGIGKKWCFWVLGWYLRYSHGVAYFFELL
jgi:hypothetical protein